jgi:hypothetical protein
MHFTIRHSLIAIAVLAGSLSWSSNALAWGCTAEDPEGATGWSTGYNSERKASNKAVRECDRHSTGGKGTCYVTECNIDW